MTFEVTSQTLGQDMSGVLCDRVIHSTDDWSEHSVTSLLARRSLTEKNSAKLHCSRSLITILLVLAFLLWPAFAKMAGKRITAVCKHNTKQVGSFKTNLRWETAEAGEAGDSSLNGCKTNAITTEEPWSINKTMSAKDMVDDTVGSICRRYKSGCPSRKAVRYVWRREEWRDWCCAWYCKPGLGTWVFILLYLIVALRYLTLLYFSLFCVKEYKENDPAEEDRETDSREIFRQGGSSKLKHVSQHIWIQQQMQKTCHFLQCWAGFQDVLTGWRMQI